jgi:hypothetical protein
MKLGDPIAAGREALNLSWDAMAQVLGVSREQLQLAADGGDAETARGVVGQLAEVLGVEVSELDEGALEQRPAAAMLRSFVDDGAGAFDELIAQGLHRELGRFTRLVRRKSRLRRLLDRPVAAPEVPAVPTPIRADERVPFGAEALANALRARLGLGDEPIESMLALLRDRLDAEVHFTTTLWSRVDGASVFSAGVRAVLVNIGNRRGRSWWRTRATLAHEVCHLLHDVGVFRETRSTLIFSPAAQPRASGGREFAPRLGERHDTFRRVEQRANAFAAYFLAPRDGVRRLFDGGEPALAPESVFAVANRFGVSPLAAANHLTNLYGWSPDHREYLLAWLDDCGYEWRPGDDHPDAVSAPPDDVELRALADEAVAKGLLLPGTRARWLGEEPPARKPAEGDRPLGFWRARTPTEAAREVFAFLRADKVGAALTVLWDAFHDWRDAGDLDACRALVAALPPREVDSNVMVSVVALLAGVPGLAPELRAYDRAARAALVAAGRGPEEIVRLLGEEPAMPLLASAVLPPRLFLA